MEMNITWMIIGVFVMGFMGILCFGLGVLNQDLEEKREQRKLNKTSTDKTKI